MTYRLPSSMLISAYCIPPLRCLRMLHAYFGIPAPKLEARGVGLDCKEPVGCGERFVVALAFDAFRSQKPAVRSQEIAPITGHILLHLGFRAQRRPRWALRTRVAAACVGDDEPPPASGRSQGHMNSFNTRILSLAVSPCQGISTDENLKRRCAQFRALPVGTPDPRLGILAIPRKLRKNMVPTMLAALRVKNAMTRNDMHGMRHT